MHSRDTLLSAYQNNNVLAFLHVIRGRGHGETNQSPEAYRLMNGGELFEAPPWVHPHRVGRGGVSTAAGAYQAVWATWNEVATEYGLGDFSPVNQDLFAIARLIYRKALDLVVGGRIPEAIRCCLSEWTSLPGGSGSRQTLEEALATYQQYGGALTVDETAQAAPEAPTEASAESSPAPDAGAAVQPAPDVGAQPATGAPMGVFAALLPTILQAIPQLVSVFSSPTDSDVAKRNQAAGVLVANTLVDATKAVNLQDAVDKLQNDPAALDAAHAAINSLLPQLVEAGGGGIEGARKSAYAQDQVPVWKNPAIIVSAAVLPLVYMVAASVLFGIGRQDWSDDVKTLVVTSIITGVLGSVLGFFLGSSMSSQKKDAAIAAATK